MRVLPRLAVGEVVAVLAGAAAATRVLPRLAATQAAVAAANAEVAAAAGVAAEFGLWRELLAHYGDRRQRARRLDVHFQTQRVLHRIARRLTRGRPKEQVVLGYGNASSGYGSIISRAGRGPHKKLQKLLAERYASVYIIDEYLTSQVRMNRDLNAAANIRLITACVEDGTPWPTALSRRGAGWIDGSGWFGGGVQMHGGG
ncbi:hypothetical protein HXX76_014250 [Chlamydomonas incerta]|uniref:Uncharacterized protein n=1 Tax=Chlamydomonas incerta TaxID=51695 RepID=A0A835VTE2_CHLIN|nr:hypothetical protein HXX76_014250 [Chlamydomonas incerta]|eukprot:KAG2424829.1 hypothetical protein HXX76_014250 [Chlamydomonas incerta]